MDQALAKSPLAHRVPSGRRWDDLEPRDQKYFRYMRSFGSSKPKRRSSSRRTSVREYPTRTRITSLPSLLLCHQPLSRQASTIRSNLIQHSIEIQKAKIQILRRTRDLLLPRLLSGQIDVEAARSMSAHAYTEDQLVEQPAVGLFAALGWQTVSALDEAFGASGTLGRETKGEVVLVDRLRAALAKFNPTLPPEAISNAVDELTRDRSAMSLEAVNREVYRLLKEGITVSVPDRERGGQKTERLRVVDWEHPEHNDF